jgi:hypothetical protein
MTFRHVSLIALLATLSVAASALETPLVITQPGGSGLTAIVDPASGVITLYQVEGNQLTRYGSGSANFLSDLSQYESLIIDEEDGKPVSALQRGSGSTRPTAQELLAALPKTQSAAEREAESLPYQDRARNAEKRFWAEKHDYDGVVRGALGNRALLLAVPSKHVLLAYEISNNMLQLRAYRNYGVELYIPQVLGSTPSPAEIWQGLPDEITEERRKELEKQAEKMGAAASKELSPLPSDVWVAASNGQPDYFAVVDFANKHIMSYQFSTRTFDLKSVRNMEIDLLIPGSWNSVPSAQQTYDAFMRDPARKRFLEAFGFEPDPASLKAMSGARQQRSNTVSTVQATIQNDDIIIDWTDKHKVYVYRLIGSGNNLELVSMRDYTLDVGMALFDDEMRSQANAKELFEQAVALTKRNSAVLAMLNLKSALKLNPLLHTEAEKNNSLVMSLGKLPDWKETIEVAAANAKKKKDEIEERKKAAADERERKKKGK